MSVYSYSDQRVESIVARHKRNRLTASAVGVFLISISTFILILSLRHPSLYDPKAGWRMFWIAPWVIGFRLIGGLWSWKARGEKVRQSYRNVSVVISPGEVSIHYPKGQERKLDRELIVRAEEASIGGGLYLRTSNRYRYFLIPKSIDDYEAIKAELLQPCIPLVHRIVPTNIEEYVWAFLSCGTLICPMIVRDVRVLTANLLLSILLSVLGMLMIRANPDNHKIRLKAFVGCLLFPLGNAAMFWLLTRH